MMQMPLQEWISANTPHDGFLWKDAWLRQVTFVRDRLAGLLARTYEEYKTLVKVVGEHRSKSVVCPVYHVRLERDGLGLWMRDNFHNWNVTVEAARPLACDFLGTFDDANFGYCCCEGMEAWKAGRHADDPARFTACVNDHYDLYAFCRVLKAHLGIKPTD